MTLDNQASSPQVTGWKREIILFLDRQIYRLTKHWLATFNTLAGAYVLLSFMAPILMVIAAPRAGRLIYLLYKPACHQLPERSIFLFGPRAAYSLEELWALGQVSEADDVFARPNFLGSPEVGFKVAICQRDIALYGGLFVGGLLFGLVRRRLRPLPLIVYALCLLPMLIDGGTQLLTIRESTPFLRLVTGGVAGLASIWLIYPHLETAFAEVRMQANKHVHME